MHTWQSWSPSRVDARLTALTAMKKKPKLSPLNNGGCVHFVLSSSLSLHHSTKNRLPSPSAKVQTNASEEEGKECEGEEGAFDEKVVNALDIDRTNFQNFNFQNLTAS